MKYEYVELISGLKIFCNYRKLVDLYKFIEEYNLDFELSLMFDGEAVDLFKEQYETDDIISVFIFDKSYESYGNYERLSKKAQSDKVKFFNRIKNAKLPKE